MYVQLPPGLRYDERTALAFFDGLRAPFAGDIVCEPHHPTWFTQTVDMRLNALQIARVVADPAIVPEARKPGGCLDVLYLRLHGAPKIYYSSVQITEAAATLRSAME